MKPHDRYRQMQAGTAPVIVDVRLPTEWMGLRIGNVLNIREGGSEAWIPPS